MEINSNFTQLRITSLTDNLPPGIKSMDALPIIYFLISSLTGFLAIVILLVYNSEQRYANGLLVITLFALAITSLNLFLFYSGLIQHLPWFYKISSPINLLTGPALYIYVRASLHGELTFRKYDWLFLLPSLIHGADMVPFFLMPAAEKQIILEQYLANPSYRMGYGKEGMIPQFVIQLFRSVWCTIFFALAIRLILHFTKTVSSVVLEQNRVLIRWLLFISWLLFFTTAGMTILYLFIPKYPNALNLAEYWFGLVILVIILGLYARPGVLYGLYLPSREGKSLISAVEDLQEKGEHERVSLPIQLELGGTFVDVKRETYRSRLESYLENQKPFLVSGYRLEDLSKDINISKNMLSAFINQEYGIGYTQLINRKRIAYILKNKDNPKWKQITLDGIGQEAGFGSKTAFFNAVRKETGMTPAQLLKEQPV